ncbi:GtrA family protein [Acidovorax sp. 94]|uniref:GtrA family protein n=1 Tax=Acidovorax sp. 94 TaxID=2135633 RepID=UPI0013140832|nr:GtrA family protein [Acidovorax sp. 94]
MNLLRKYLITRDFSRFVVVGGLGFCIDAGLLTILIEDNLDVMLARSCSFFVAVSATWMLNRLWTFNSGGFLSIRREYAYYFSVQILGAAINLSIFFILIDFCPEFLDIPLIPLAFGAIASLMFNYVVSKKIVFKSESI